jgi:SAM-dependent methyltransferase
MSRPVSVAGGQPFDRVMPNFPQRTVRQSFNPTLVFFRGTSCPPNSVGLDVGCGSGRWSVMVAPKVGHLHLLDASADALAVARQNLAEATNVSFHLASVGNIPLDDNSLDFAFSLGVLHHVPDTAAAIRAIATKLKVVRRFWSASIMRWTIVHGGIAWSGVSAIFRVLNFGVAANGTTGH